jgi:hypothetical protein
MSKKTFGTPHEEGEEKNLWDRKFSPLYIYLVKWSSTQ